MAGRSCKSRIWIAATAVMTLLMGAVWANAAEIKVLSSVALTSALDELAPVLERTSGNKLVIEYGVAAQLKERFLAGAAADVLILTRQLMDDLQQQGKVTGSLTNLGGTAVAVTVRSGAPKPDISSVEAFKRALVSVKSVVYADPAKGGASGVYFARVIDRLGLTEQLKAKRYWCRGLKQQRSLQGARPSGELRRHLKLYLSAGRSCLVRSLEKSPA